MRLLYESNLPACAVCTRASARQIPPEGMINRDVVCPAEYLGSD